MTEEERRKKKVFVVLAIVMVCCLAIVGTLAWLRYRTDDAVNTFTLGAGVKVELKEEKYEKQENLDRVADFTPGMLLDKDPTVYIPTGASVEEYIAVTVRYYIEHVDYATKTIKYEEVPYETFQDYATIWSFQSFQTVTGGAVATGSGVISSEEEKNYNLADGFRNGWVHDSNYRIFYYGSTTKDYPLVATDSAIDEFDDVIFTPVTSGAAITLFDKVEVSKNYDRYSKGFNEDKYRYTEKDTYKYTCIYNGEEKSGTVDKTKGQLKGFRIDVSAYAVQGNIDAKTAKEQLNGLIEEHIGLFPPNVSM